MLLEGASPSWTARWQWGDWQHGATAQPRLLQVTKAQGLAVRKEVQRGFQGTWPSWLFPAPIPTPAVLRGGIQSRAGLAGTLRRGGKAQRFHGQSSRGTPASLVAQPVKNLPAMQETRVRSLGGEDPLEKEMASHSSILAWRLP